MAIKSFGEANIEKIKLLERTYSLSLPEDYVSFLLSYNGGIVSKEEECEVYISSLHDSVHVDILFGIGTDNKNTEINTWMNLFGDEMSDGAIIIGDSIEHGFIVLMCTETDFGVCYWDDTYGFPNSNDETNTYFITDTFTDFVKNLL